MYQHHVIHRARDHVTMHAEYCKPELRDTNLAERTIQRVGEKLR